MDTVKAGTSPREEQVRALVGGLLVAPAAMCAGRMPGGPVLVPRRG